MSLKLMIHSETPGTIHLANGSTFHYTVGNHRSRDQALQLAGEHVLEWRRTAEARAGRKLTEKELASGRVMHAPASKEEKRAHEEVMDILNPRVDPLQRNLTAAQTRLEVERRRGMTKAERAVYWARRALEDRDAELAVPVIDPAVEKAVAHAKGTLGRLESDPTATEADLLRARERVVLAERSPELYAQADRQFRSERLAAGRSARDEHRARLAADDEAANREMEQAYARLIPKPVEVSTEVETPAAPAAPSASYALPHARIGLTLAKTPADRERYEKALTGLADGSLSPEAYFAAEPQ